LIYLDSSVALADILSEERTPPEQLFSARNGSSRLLAYEVWNRLHAFGLGESHGDRTRALLGRVLMIELEPRILARALQPFPLPVRTLDGLHLASMAFLRAQGESVELASFDKRLNAAAEAMQFGLFPL
jgi:hypothetical protein